MNETAAHLIRELANKMGTTSEHLWGVLIRQAPIFAISNLAVLSLWGAILFVTYRKLVRWKPRSILDDKELLWAAWFIMTGLFVVCLGISSPYILAGFINPEYWALHEVLDALSK